LLGFFQGISHERVEDLDRQRLNEGIKRSFRNSGIMGIIGGGVIGGVGILSLVLFNGLSEGLHAGLHAEFGLFNGVASLSDGLQMGLSEFPWQTASFLEDAQARIFVQRVGGGYSFTHRLLLDYFADLNQSGSSTAPATSTVLSLPNAPSV
jgi:hypothetical protein